MSTDTAEDVRGVRSAILAALFHDAPDWAAKGLCRSLGDDAWELFFPTRGEDISAAKAICADCPVIVECREYALANVERHGCWGGTSERERRDERHRRRCTRDVCSHHAHVEHDPFAKAEERIGVEIAPAYRTTALWPAKRASRRLSIRITSAA